MVECPECGHAVADDLVFCSDCGHEVRAPALAGGAEGDGVALESDADAVSAEDDAGAGEDAADEARTVDVSGPSPHERHPLSFAVGYPVRDSAVPLVVGGIAEALAILLVPLLVVRGYGFQLAGAAARGQTRPPDFGNGGRLLADGGRVLVVGIVAGVAAVLLASGVLAASDLVGAGGQVRAVLLGLVVAGIAYVLPAALTAAAAERDLSAAVSGDHAVAFLTSGWYARGYVSFVLVVAVGAALAFVSLATIIGPVFVTVWLYYAVASLWGHYYRGAVAREIVPAPPATVIGSEA